MEEADFKELKEKAKQRKKAHKKLLDKLSKRPPKHLDNLMVELHEEEFTRTDCLDCANCCKTTGPLFTQRDIERLSKHFRIKPAAFIQQYLRIDEDQDYVLQQLPCPFLLEDNRCSVYDHRPKACREFPHTDRKNFPQIKSLTMKNVAICPAAFRIVEALEKAVQH